MLPRAIKTRTKLHQLVNKLVQYAGSAFFGFTKSHALIPLLQTALRVVGSRQFVLAARAARIGNQYFRGFVYYGKLRTLHSTVCLSIFPVLRHRKLCVAVNGNRILGLDFFFEQTELVQCFFGEGREQIWISEFNGRGESNCIEEVPKCENESCFFFLAC